jgi:hypothetical protein
MVTKCKGSGAKNPQKSTILSFRYILIRAQKLKSAHRSTVDPMALRSMVDKKFWTPPTILPLTVGGGGGSDMEIKEGA